MCQFSNSTKFRPHMKIKPCNKLINRQETKFHILEKKLVIKAESFSLFPLDLESTYPKFLQLCRKQQPYHQVVPSQDLHCHRRRLITCGIALISAQIMGKSF